MAVTKLRLIVMRHLVRVASIPLLALVGVLSLASAATFAASADAHGITDTGPAQIYVNLAVDPAGVLMPGESFNYDLTVTNNGPGAANDTSVSVPLDANVVVDNFASSSPSVYVDYLGSDSINIRFNKLDPYSTTTATIMAHVIDSAPQPLMISSRAMINWSDVHSGMSAVSNVVEIAVGTGAVAPATTQTLQTDATGSIDAGTPLTLQGAFYEGKESISLWINTPAGTVLPATSLGQTDTALQGSVAPLDALGYADAQGNFTYVLNTAGLPSGTYTVVAHGWVSGLEGVATFTIN